MIGVDGGRVPLALEDAKIKAKSELKRVYGEAVLAQLNIRRDNARLERLEQRAIADEEEAKRNGNLNAAKRTAALHLIQGNVRKYFARQEVKRRIRFNWRKEFDPVHLCYFYQHRNNGQVRWDKPQLLGRSDLPAPKRWYHVRDQSFEPGASYWLQPRTGEMTFDAHRIGAHMCVRHVNEFATAFCADCTLFLCEACVQVRDAVKPD